MVGLGKAQVCVDVPAELLRAEMQAATARALVEIGPDKMVEKVIAVAFAEKVDNYSSSETKFSRAINEMVRAAAKEEFRTQLERLKPRIRKAIAQKIAGKGKDFVDDVASQIVDSMASNFYVSIRLKVEGD